MQIRCHLLVAGDQRMIIELSLIYVQMVLVFILLCQIIIMVA